MSSSEPGARTAPRGAGWLSRLTAQAAARPDAVALREFGGEERSYAALVGGCERLRAALRREGVTAGEAVALLLPAGRDLIEGFAAVTSLGAIAVPLSPSLTLHELPALLELADPAVVVTEGELLRRVAPVLRAQGGLRAALVVDASGDGLSALDGEGYRARAVGEERSALDEPAPDALVGCHFTYKGLGYPLGALHRYGSYTLSVESLESAFLPGPDDLHLVALPFHQVYGLVSAVVGPLCHGNSLLLAQRLNPRRLLALLSEERVRFACLVPALFPFLISAARSGRPELHPELCLLSGGSLLDRDLAHETADALGVEPYQGYGLSESLPIVTNSPGRNRPGALGWPLPDVALRICDAQGEEQPAGVAGEILASGPTVMAGYRRRPRETARFLRDGWLRTGDLGWRDADGALHFLGRREPFAKVGGQMVDLVEVEQTLRAHRAVHDACAFSVPGRTGQPELRAAVILAGRTSVRLGELFALARERLSPFKVPRRIKIYRAHYEQFEADF